jgi:HK97 family phage major capsid protein
MPTDVADPKPRVFTKGYLPPSIDRHSSNVAEVVASKAPDVLRFPLGDIDNFSVGRVCYARTLEQLGQSHDVAWGRWAPWEKQYLEALNQVQYKALGDQVSGVDGGFLAPELWSSQWFSLLRSAAILDQLPVRRISFPIRLARIPKVTGDVTVTYESEGVALATTSFQFGQSTFSPRKATALINVSNELLRDAPETADQVLRQESAAAIATDRDTQALIGNGQAGAPVGLINNPKVTKYYPGASATAAISTTPAHGTPSFLHLSQLKGKVTSLNGSSDVTAGQAQCTGMIAHTRFEQTVLTQAAAATAWTDAQGRPLWMTGLSADGGLLGVKFPLTNILPTTSSDGGGSTSSYIIAGYWERYVIWECMALAFDATPHGDGFVKDETQVRIVHRYDAQPAQPEAFAVLAGCDQ